MTPSHALDRAPAARSAGDALLDDTLRLIEIPSTSGAEQAVADHLEERLRGCAHLRLTRVRHSLIARTERGHDTRLLLAGHVDTVPPVDPAQEAGRDDVTVRGRGAVDMKGGVAVLMRLAETVLADASVDVTVVLYDREETGSHGSGMRLLVETAGELLHADAGVLLEPTGGWAELGCQGNLGMRAVFRGTAAHTARPWKGDNAVRRAAPAIARCADHRVREQHIDGHVYPQALEIVGVRAGTGINVVPASCELTVNARYAPNRTRDEVVAELTGLLAGADELEVTLDSPAALPSLDSPSLRRLVEHPQVRSRPKLGWTDVGRLAQLGVPAVNFGPGDPELAHGPAEVVHVDDLVFVHDRLVELVTS